MQLHQYYMNTGTYMNPGPRHINTSNRWGPPWFSPRFCGAPRALMRLKLSIMRPLACDMHVARSTRNAIMRRLHCDMHVTRSTRNAIMCPLPCNMHVARSIRNAIMRPLPCDMHLARSTRNAIMCRLPCDMHVARSTRNAIMRRLPCDMHVARSTRNAIMRRLPCDMHVARSTRNAMTILVPNTYMFGSMVMNLRQNDRDIIICNAKCNAYDNRWKEQNEHGKMCSESMMHRSSKMIGCRQPYKRIYLINTKYEHQIIIHMFGSTIYIYVTIN